MEAGMSQNVVRGVHMQKRVQRLSSICAYPVWREQKCQPDNGL